MYRVILLNANPAELGAKLDGLSLDDAETMVRKLSENGVRARIKRTGPKRPTSRLLSKDEAEAREKAHAKADAKADAK